MSRADTALRYFRENAEFMRTTVEDNIERYKKGDATLRFVDRSGKPVAGVLLEGTQTGHEFKHGGNIFMLDELETPEKNQIYRDSFPSYYNLATIPFYWSDLEPEEGKPRFAADSPRVYRRPATDLCVDYCREKGIEPKCHCLNYENFAPEWLRGRSVAEHKRLLEKRFSELAERYSAIIPSWEVTNETFNPASVARTPFFMEDDFVEWSFRTADRYFPKNRLVINDYKVFGGDYRWNRSPYYMQIERLLANGITHLDSVGIQYHSFFMREAEEKMAAIRYNPVHLYEVMDLYARFGRKLQVTEMTIPAYSNDPEDEEVQATLLRYVYKTFFSHPAMEAMIYWNLVDGYAAWAPQGDMEAGENKYFGGLLRFDMSEKPAAKALHDLFSRELHTDIPERECAASAAFRGFYGNYTLKATANGRTTEHRISLSSSGANEFTLTV